MMIAMLWFFTLNMGISIAVFDDESFGEPPKKEIAMRWWSQDVPGTKPKPPLDESEDVRGHQRSKLKLGVSPELSRSDR